MAIPLWQRPSLRTDEEEHRERKTSWLDLFFDLVFVTVIAELAHYLAKHLAGDGVAGFVLLFIPAWWVWIGATVYGERFETDDLSHRLITFVLMLPVAGLAYHVHDALGTTAVGFALSYVAARLVIIFMWLRGGLYAPRTRPMTTRYALGFSVSVVLWLLSIAVPPPARYALWALGLFIDLTTPLTTVAAQRRLPRLSTSRLPERFGLFMLIVLGESVVAVVSVAAAQHDLTLLTALAGVLGLSLAASLWSIYFDSVYPRRLPPHPAAGLVWNYAHMVLAMGLTATGAAMLLVLLTPADATLPLAVRGLLCGAQAVTFAALGLIEAVTQGGHAGEDGERRVVRGGAVVAVVGLGLIGGALPTLALMGALVVINLAQVAFGLRHRESEAGSTHAE